MNIRWYKNGKLNKFKEDNKSEIIDNMIDVGSYVYLPMGVLYYHDIRTTTDEIFDKNLWKRSSSPGNNIKVLRKKYIDTQYYTGDIIKLEERWPWYQTIGIVSLKR